ncbi:sperm-associated antigen 8 isoform X4 [Oreochromis niloticus]|uniref:Sperm associated antigen 8 n=1 Tax=Oreochromis niloticus TaxID=8128 RepID=A0A669ENR0_ORENI|nr:sperm-associated antigen 8 isoform X4 [Oreochromis niloticus]
MTEQTAAAGHKVGKPMSHNWVEERAKMESVTTLKAAYVVPKSPVVRLQGIRGELLKKHTAQMISEKIRADLNPQTPKTEYCSTTQKDFCVEGFVPFKPETTRIHDYKTDQAITFWSENCQRIQGVTAARSLKGPFRKSALFSTPITERLDEIDLPPDN